MKAFIFAAGYGTRNLPITKSVPKELFPLYNKTALDFILEECAEAGIYELVILTSSRKILLENYFDRDIELEISLTESNKVKELDLLHYTNQFKVSFIHQQEMKGTGHALISAGFLLDKEPFVAFFPDDIVLHTPGGALQVLDLYKETQCSVLGAREEYHNISAYGVIESIEKNNVSYVTKIVEKPQAYEVNSNLVSVGRFVYTPEFMDVLKIEYMSHKHGEFYPMGAMMQMAKAEKLVVKKLLGKILDTGNQDSYLNAVLEYAYTTIEGKKIIDNFINRLS